VRYLQLAHNEWDPATKTSRPKVLYSFGREDSLDRAVIERLVASLCRLLEPGAALAARTAAGLSFVESRCFGGAWLLDALWRRLGIDKVMTEMLTGCRREAATERVLLGLVANRAQDASSKLAARRLDLAAGAHRRARGDHRRRLLPGDALAHRRGAPAGTARLRPSRQPAQPRSRPAVLRYHLDVLRAR
jgi:hypothetical protein